MRPLIASLLVICCLLLTSCASQPADAPHATVLMRDGSSVTGTITASSPAEVTLAGDDKQSHVIPMKQVSSIQYDEPAPAATPASSTATPPSTTPSSTPAPPPSPAASQLAHRDHYHPPLSQVSTKTYVLPVGTQISVRAEETIDSSRASEGQTFAAEVTKDVRDADGAIVIPDGSNAKIVIKSESKGGKITGRADLVLDLRAVSVEGQEYLIGTSDLEKKGRDSVGANKRTAIFTGGGTAIGAIIGAIAGGGKGAAIGAASGAGAGAITQVVTKGSSIKIPAETILTFKLDRALHVDAAQ